MTAGSKSSWRLKYEARERDTVTGKRQTRYVTVRGTKKDAQKELIRLLNEVENGTAVDPSKVTVAEYLRGWLASDTGLAPKTRERYGQLAEQQIIPHLGALLLQKLRPVQVHDWHATLLNEGGKNGKPLSARTVGHAHRVLHRGLERALRLEAVSRNVAHAVQPPRVESAEVAILTADQIGAVLSVLDAPQPSGQNSLPEPHPLFPIAVFALGTGMRRGEICALGWRSVKLDTGTVCVERSLEETKEGLRFKPPKTRYGRRTISLPAYVVDVLRRHRHKQAELRMALGLGRPGADDLVFTLPDGSLYPPDKLSRDWGNVVRDRKLPRVMFHALRHSHASALIAAGLDVVSVSRRLGHGSPAITLKVYAHSFATTDDVAARAIEAAMKAGAKPAS